MNVQSTVPSVLQQNQAVDESQDTVLNTIRLEPTSTSQVTTTFVLPKSGSVLDSNSSLIWSIGWDAYDAGKNDGNQLVCLKQFSGGLNSIRRARFYVGGRLLFTNPDVALTSFIHKLGTNPDHAEQVSDVKLGSQHGYYDSSNGRIKAAEDVSNQLTNNRLCRQLGSYSVVPTANFSWECTLLLSEAFPALKHLQIPIKHLKDEVRVEIDWETDFNEVATIISEVNDQITPADQRISINNPLLFLDYLTYNEEVEMGLATAAAQGITLPYREINMISRTLPATNTTALNTQDILLGFQGKLLMKVYVSHRFNDNLAANDRPASYQKLNGRCRCDRGQNFKYNLTVNDLHIHDSLVDTPSQTHSYMAMTAESPINVFPNTYDFNSKYAIGAAGTDINFAQMVVSGQTNNGTNNGLSDQQARDGISGTQAWIGFDLSRYGVDGGLNPQNSGYRVGSTPMVLQLEQQGSTTADSRQRLSKRVDVICESVKILQIRNGLADTMDA